jgi:formylglycine-generating enzyme required for sulfatase activity
MKTSIVWPWGHYWPPQTGDGNYAPDLQVDTITTTAPVGSFRPNIHGLYDMGGNVWEWCNDWFNEAQVTKALRGGSFNDAQPTDLLATYRFSGTMNLTGEDMGFRIVLE